MSFVCAQPAIDCLKKCSKKAPEPVRCFDIERLDFAGVAAIIVSHNRLRFFVRVFQTFSVALFSFIQSVKHQIIEINFHHLPALFVFVPGTL
jgi:hypothetical protein